MAQSVLRLHILGSCFPVGLLLVRQGPGRERQLGRVACIPFCCGVRSDSAPWAFQMCLPTPNPEVSADSPHSPLPHPRGRTGLSGARWGQSAAGWTSCPLLPESPPQVKHVKSVIDKEPLHKGADLTTVGLTNRPLRAEDRHRGGFLSLAQSFRPHVLCPS